MTGVGANLQVTSITGRASGELFAASSSAPWLAHSTDKGASWTNGIVSSLGGASLYQVALTPLGDYLYATSNELLVSQDGGMNFVPVQTAPVPAAIAAVFAVSASDVYGATGNGLVHFGN